MNHDIALLLAGSFLPNNLLFWIVRRINKAIKREGKKYNIKLVSPKRYYREFASDPKVQYNYHTRMQKFWLVNFIPMNVIVGISVWATLTNRLSIAVLLSAVLLGVNTNYSLYANFDTETGDAHAAYAGIRTDEIRAGGSSEDILDDQIDDIVGQLDIEQSMPGLFPKAE